MYKLPISEREIEARSVPSLIQEATKRAFTASKTAGISEDTKLPLVSRAVNLDGDHIREYMKITGQADNGYIPPLYYFTRAFRSMVTIVADPGSPIRMFGVMHKSNLLTVDKAVAIDEKAELQVSTWLSACEQGERGQDLIFSTNFSIESEQIATMETTSFLRNRKAQKRAREPGELSNEWGRVTQLQFEENQGLIYARISDDWNAFHITQGLARLFGSPEGMILQGACTAAMMMGKLPEDPVNVNGQGTVRMAFKRPVQIPGKQDMYAVPRQGEEGERAYVLWDEKKRQPSVELGLT